MLTETIINGLVSSGASKALATFGPSGLNVVPVSSVKVVDGNIWLIDYFFDKTRENVKNSPSVSLVFWEGLVGSQIKGTVSYETSGKDFDSAVAWIASEHPTRKVSALVKITPTEVCDISIDKKV